MYIKIKEALQTLNIKVTGEITRRELKFTYLGLDSRYNPIYNTEYADEAKLLKIKEAYEFLDKNIKDVNEAIRNNFEVKKEEPIDNTNQNMNLGNEATINQRPAITQIQIRDKVSIFSIIVSFLIPLYGLLNYFFTRRITPKSSKYYLLAGVVGVVLNFIILMI